LVNRVCLAQLASGGEVVCHGGIVSLCVLRHCAGRASSLCRCVVSLNKSAGGVDLGCIV